MEKNIPDFLFSVESDSYGISFQRNGIINDNRYVQPYKHGHVDQEIIKSVCICGVKGSSVKNHQHLKGILS